MGVSADVVSAAPLLQIADLTVRYDGVLALEGASLDVPPEGAVALLGPNGAGKTTLLRAISGLLGFHGGRVTSGSILYEGEPIVRKDAAHLVRKGIVQVLEGRHVFAELTVAENLRAGAFTQTHRQRSASRLEQVVALFPLLGQRMRQPAGLLSGGEQQMLAIGRALMGQPRLLLLDEPSLGLAPRVIQSIGDALARVHADGVSILLVEQSSALAQAVTNSGYLLDTGRIRAAGRTESLLADEQVRAAYLGVQGA